MLFQLTHVTNCPFQVHSAYSRVQHIKSVYEIKKFSTEILFRLEKNPFHSDSPGWNGQNVWRSFALYLFRKRKGIAPFLTSKSSKSQHNRPPNISIDPRHQIIKKNKTKTDKRIQIEDFWNMNNNHWHAKLLLRSERHDESPNWKA